MSGLGVVLAALELRHWFKMDTLVGKLLEVILPLVLAVTLVYAGYWLSQSAFDADHVLRIVGWVAVGTVGSVLVARWVIGHQLIRGLPFDHTPFVLTNVLIVGGLGGFVIGVYDARSEVREEELATEREKMVFLNRLVRHNILNDMNVVLGRASALEDHMGVNGQPAVEAVLTRGKDVVTLTRKMRTFTHVIANGDGTELEATDLSARLEREIEKIDASYDVTITADVPSEVYVEADDLLAELFGNLLMNAVEHNDAGDPRVRVWVDERAASVVVNVADNGPGVSDEEKEVLFDRQGTDIDNTGGGIGLLLVGTLVDQYDGDVWVEDSESDGALFRVELPTL